MKLTPQYRTYQFRADTVNTESRTVELSFSSAEPVERYWMGEDVDEVLDHSPGCVRLDRLNQCGPLLENHEADDQIGCVDSAFIRDGKGCAVVRFSKSEAGQAALDDVRDGIRRNVSVGYRVYRAVPGGINNSRKELRIIDWEPFEISLVSIPADTTVGVGRNQQLVENEFILEKKMDNPTPTPAPQPPAPEVLAEHSKRAMLAERQRVSDLQTIGKDYGCVDAARKAIEDGTTIEQFRVYLLENVLKAKKVTPTAPKLDDMERSAKRKYSLCRLLNILADPRGVVDGFEAEVHQELFKGKGERSITGTMVPLGVFGLRANNVTTASAGGYTVDEDFMGAEFIEKLDNPTVIQRAGARTLTGLMGDVVIPTQTSGATAYWLTEQGAATDSEVAFGQLKLAPHRLGVSIPWTRQLSLQSSLDIEGLIRTDANKRIALAIDTAAMTGTGTSGQPKGLFNYDTSNSGINTVTYGAAATFAKTREAVAAIGSDNVPGTPTFLIDWTSWSKWSTKVIDAGSGFFLWGGGETGDVRGFPGIVSQFLPSNKSVAGVFQNMLLAYWEGVDVIVDPYSQKKSGVIEIMLQTHVDIAVRYPEAFCISTDSAAQ